MSHYVHDARRSCGAGLAEGPTVARRTAAAGPAYQAKDAIDARLAQQKAIRLGMAAFDADSARHAADLMRDAFGLGGE